MEVYKNFYIENKSRVFAYLLYLTGDYHLSDDLVQESFTRYLDRYGTRAKSCALLFTIARNAAMDAIRKRKEDRIYPVHEATLVGNPEVTFSEKQNVSRILAAVQKLNEADRELIAVVAAGKLTYKEIGELLNFSEANVKIRVHRARLKLRDILNAGG